jgi:hypothetical protein
MVLDIMTGIEVTDKRKAKEAFNAWRVHLLDLMAQEYDKNEWAKDAGTDHTNFELLDDIRYYNRLVDQEHR